MRDNLSKTAQIIIFVVMNVIVDHIEYLLRKHDCVIVPGWGAFIAQYSSAKLDEHSGVATPPKRSFIYNGFLTFSDGLLENSVMRKDGCSYSVASSRIRDCVEQLWHQLDEDGMLAFGKLGKFEKNDENQAVFVPFDVQGVPTDCFGFKKFRALPVEALRQKEAVDEVGGDEIDENLRNKILDVVFKKEYLRVAASVIALIVISLVLITPIPADRQLVNKASIDDSFRVKEGVRTLAQACCNRELAVALPESALREIAKERAEHDKPIDGDFEGKEANSRFEGDCYCLVVASAYSKKEAERFVRHQKTGDELRIYKTKEGKYRVYVASGNSCERMLDVRKELKHSYPDAWVCVR